MLDAGSQTVQQQEERKHYQDTNDVVNNRRFLNCRQLEQLASALLNPTNVEKRKQSHQR
jgi:hypothetical protein